MSDNEPQRNTRFVGVRVASPQPTGYGLVPTRCVGIQCRRASVSKHNASALSTAFPRSAWERGNTRVVGVRVASPQRADIVTVGWANGSIVNPTWMPSSVACEKHADPAS